MFEIKQNKFFINICILMYILLIIQFMASMARGDGKETFS